MPRKLSTDDLMTKSVAAAKRDDLKMAETWRNRAVALDGAAVEAWELARMPKAAKAKRAAKPKAEPAVAGNGGSSGPRPGSKVAMLIDALTAGATIAQLCELTGWQKSAVHGAFSNDCARHGHKVVRDGDLYRLADRA